MNQISLSPPAPGSMLPHDTGLACRYIKRHYREAGPIHLFAIFPDGQLEGRKFDSAEDPVIATWIDERQGRANLYYSVNRPNADFRGAKPSDNDIGELLAVVVDVDPRKDEEAKPGGHEKERARILKTFQDLPDDRAPCALIDSGGGYQAIYWLKESAELLNPVPAVVEAYKNVGRRLAAYFGGDAVHEPSRLMRLPGTVNRPNTAKKKRGRIERVASMCTYTSDFEVLKRRHNRRWTLDELVAAFPPVPDGERNPDTTQATGAAPQLDWQAVLDGPDDDLSAKFEKACRDYPKLKRRWDGDAEGLGQDQSRSVFDMSLAGLLKSQGEFDFEDYCRLSVTWEYGRNTAAAADYYWRAWSKSKAEPRQSAPRDFAFGKEEDLDRYRLKTLEPKDLNNPDDAAYLAWLRKERPALFDEWLAPFTLFDTDANEVHGLLAAVPPLPAGIDIEALRERIKNGGRPALFEPETSKRIARLKLTAPVEFHRLRDESGALRTFDQAADRGETLLAEEVHWSTDRAAGKTAIYVEKSRLEEAVDQTEATLASAQEPHTIYRYADALCVIDKAESGAGGVEIRRLERAALRVHAMRVCQFYMPRAKDGAQVPSECPDLLLDSLMALRGGRANRLEGVITCPTIRPDGSLLRSPGYDRATGLYATFDPALFPAPPERLAQSDAQEAYQFLAETVFEEFPFATETDRATAVAALITGVLRRGMRLAPAWAICAPVQSTGKTALARMIGALAFNGAPPASSWPGNDSELSKTIFSMLLRGQPMILFDNVEAGARIDGGTGLPEMLTSETYEGRILGVSKTAIAPTRVLLLLNGNNLSFGGDAASRFLTVRLDAKDARPDQRAFKRRDLERWAMKHRGDVIRAALSIPLAYIQAGSPKIDIKGSRFPDFLERVAAPLV